MLRRAKVGAPMRPRGGNIAAPQTGIVINDPAAFRGLNFPQLTHGTQALLTGHLGEHCNLFTNSGAIAAAQSKGDVWLAFLIPPELLQLLHWKIFRSDFGFDF